MCVWQVRLWGIIRYKNGHSTKLVIMYHRSPDVLHVYILVARVEALPQLSCQKISYGVAWRSHLCKRELNDLWDVLDFYITLFAPIPILIPISVFQSLLVPQEGWPSIHSEEIRSEPENCSHTPRYLVSSKSMVDYIDCKLPNQGTCTVS